MSEKEVVRAAERCPEGVSEGRTAKHYNSLTLSHARTSPLVRSYARTSLSHTALEG
jgi:hypothetical protein